MKRKTQTAVLCFCGVSAAIFACGRSENETDVCDRIGKDPWFGIGGSEILPWSVRIKAQYPDESYFCGDGLTASSEAGLVAAPSGDLFLMSANNSFVRWNGSTWNNPLYEDAFEANGASLALDSQERPIFAGTILAAWGGPKVWVGRYGDSFFDLSGSDVGVDPSAETPLGPSLVVNKEDKPILAWYDTGFNPDRVFVSQLEGEVWIGLDGTPNRQAIGVTGIGAVQPALGIDSQDQVLLLWNEAPAEFLRRFEDGEWRDIDGSSADSGLGLANNVLKSFLLVDSDDEPLAAWLGQLQPGKAELKIRRHASVGWQVIPGPDGSDTFTMAGETADITLDRDDQPVVAWEEEGEIYLLRYDGKKWQDVNDSAGANGISNSLGYSTSPRVVATNKTICVAYYDTMPKYCGEICRSDEIPMEDGGDLHLLIRCSHY